MDPIACPCTPLGAIYNNLKMWEFDFIRTGKLHLTHFLPFQISISSHSSLCASSHQNERLNCECVQCEWATISELDEFIHQFQMNHEIYKYKIIAHCFILVGPD